MRIPFKSTWTGSLRLQSVTQPGNNLAFTSVRTETMVSH